MIRKKILHIIQSLDSGGCENMMLRRLPLLNEFDQEIVTLRKEGELADSFREKGIKVINIGQKNFLDIGSFVRIFREVKRINPDVIVTYLFHADVVGRIFLQFVAHKPIVSFLVTTHNFPKYWPARLFERLSKYFAKQYFANSEEVKKVYVNNFGVADNKIKIVHNGVNIYDYKISDERKGQVRQSLGINANDFIICCVANLNVNKGHKYLLEAFEKVSNAHDNLTLILIGEGPERHSMENQVTNYKSKNKIKLLGRRRDVNELLAISSVFAFPSFFEGMSVALLEAMACGLACIVSDIPENKALIKDGYSGLLFSKGDSVNLSEKILEVLNDEKLRWLLGVRAKEEVENNFSISASANKFQQEIKNILQ